MLIARRVYVYFISAVSLGMAAVGLANLLGLALSRLAEALGGSVMRDSPEQIRRQVSLYAAFVIVALPVWLLHWWLAERSVRRASAEGEDERKSAIRALYLTLARALPLIVLIIAATDVASQLLRKAFLGSFTIGGASGMWLSVGIVLVTLGIMIYHSQVRRCDAATGELEGAAVWLPRLYVYAAAFAGAMFLLFGIYDLIGLVDDLLFGARNVYVASRWWADPVGSAIGRILVGLAVWSIHWDWSLRSLRRDDQTGASERRSSLRWFYVYAIVFVGVIFTLNGVVSSLDALFRWLLDVPRSNLRVGWARSIIEPLVLAVPFAGFWAYHRLVVLRAAPADERAPLAVSLRRIYTYLVAFVGLALTGVGAAWVLGILIDLLFGGSRTVSISSVFWRDDVATFSAFAIVGAGTWLWHWDAAERQVSGNETTERQATTRRIYLFTTLGATLIAILVSLALVIYRVISAVLDVSSGTGLVSAISTSLGIAIIAGTLFAYHVLVLRQDLAAREVPTELRGAIRVPLVLSAPPDADVDAVLSDLRAHLPEGFVLESAATPKRASRLADTGHALERDHA